MCFAAVGVLLERHYVGYGLGALDLENRQLRWANRQLQQLGPFVERQNMQIDQKSWHIIQ